MLTANVGHGHDVAEWGNALLRAARSSVPSAPPAKIAAISCRSACGSTLRFRAPGTDGSALPEERPGSGGKMRSADDSATRQSSFDTVKSVVQKPSAALG